MAEHTHIRRLLPIDRDALGHHLLRLDGEDRQLRFGSTVSDALLRSYANCIYRLDTLIFGHFINDVLRAIGELRPYSFTDGKRAEIAFSVEKPWQSKGIGSLLMQRVVTAARNRGIAKLTVFCLPTNEPMRRLANRFGAHMHAERGAVEGDIEADPATPFTLLGETIQEAHGLVSAFWDQASAWTEGTHR